MADLNKPQKKPAQTSLPPAAPANPHPDEQKQRARLNLAARPPASAQTDLSANAREAPPAAKPIRPPTLRPPVPQSLTPPAVRPPTAVPPGLKIERSLPPNAPRPPAKESIPGATSVGESHQAGLGPNKETARIAIAAEKPREATTEADAPPANLVRRAALPPPVSGDSIPSAFCWVLVAVSAITLLIQLWTYFS